MSYLHLQKNWPIALSIVAHIAVLSWVNNSPNLPTQTLAPIKTITVTLVEHHSREITQPVKPPALTPPAKPVSTEKVTSAIKTVMPTAVLTNTSTAQVIVPTTVAVTESRTAQVIEQATAVVTETRIEQVTEIPPAKPTVEYTPPSLSAAYLHNPVPTYPLIAKRMGQQGHVLLQVTVSETGQTVVVVVLQSSGYALLDQSAVQAVKNWQFVPARANQQAVTAQVTIPVRFTLES